MPKTLFTPKLEQGRLGDQLAILLPVFGRRKTDSYYEPLFNAVMPPPIPSTLTPDPQKTYRLKIAEKIINDMQFREKLLATQELPILIKDEDDHHFEKALMQMRGVLKKLQQTVGDITQPQTQNEIRRVAGLDTQSQEKILKENVELSNNRIQDVIFWTKSNQYNLNPILEATEEELKEAAEEELKEDMDSQQSSPSALELQTADRTRRSTTTQFDMHRAKTKDTVADRKKKMAEMKREFQSNPPAGLKVEETVPPSPDSMVLKSTTDNSSATIQLAGDGAVEMTFQRQDPTSSYPKNLIVNALNANRKLVGNDAPLEITKGRLAEIEMVLKFAAGEALPNQPATPNFLHAIVLSDDIKRRMSDPLSDGSENPLKHWIKEIDDAKGAFQARQGTRATERSTTESTADGADTTPSLSTTPSPQDSTEHTDDTRPSLQRHT